MWIIRTSSIIQVPKPGLRLIFPDLSIESGAVSKLLGANGVGKSTLLRILAGLEQPHQGTIHFLPGWPRLRRLFIPCDFQFYGYATLGQNLKLFAQLYGVERSAPQLDGIFYYAGLEPLMKTPTARLSHGQRQAAALSLLFMIKPRLAFIDEPFVHLDANIRNLFEGLFPELVAEGATLIFTEVSHAQPNQDGSAITFSVERPPQVALP